MQFTVVYIVAVVCVSIPSLCQALFEYTVDMAEAGDLVFRQGGCLACGPQIF